jgi:hypothetical protein
MLSRTPPRHVFSRKTVLPLTGPYHGDPLVPSIEIMLKQTRGGKLTVFHINAEQDGFWDKD